MSNSTFPSLLTSSGGQSRTIYFAYGSNLSITQMRARCPASAVPLGVAILSSYQWFIAERGYANVIAVDLPALDDSVTDTATVSPSADVGGQQQRKIETNAGCVYGLIYSLTAGDEEKLDGYEGWRVARSGGINANVDERIWRPMLQGSCSYNKLNLLVHVLKWLVEPHEIDRYLGSSSGGIGTPSPQRQRSPHQVHRRTASGQNASRSSNLVRALVYVDEVNQRPGRIRTEYVSRMSQAVAESVPLGVPEDWVDQTMKQHGIVWYNTQPGGTVGGKKTTRPSANAPTSAQWQTLRERFVRSIY